MSYDFDRIIERRDSDSMKWQGCGEDDLALWVADMDFAAPPAVMETLRRRIEHPVYGYGVEPPRLRELIVERWRTVRLGGRAGGDRLHARVVPGFHFALRALSVRPGDPHPDAGLSAHPPAAGKWRMQARYNPLQQGRGWPYEVDFDNFEAQAAQSGLFLL